MGSVVGTAQNRLVKDPSACSSTATCPKNMKPEVTSPVVVPPLEKPTEVEDDPGAGTKNVALLKGGAAVPLLITGAVVLGAALNPVPDVLETECY